MTKRRGGRLDKYDFINRFQKGRIFLFLLFLSLDFFLKETFTLTF